MWQELTTLWQNIRDPEYLHLLLEPLPLYELGLGLVFVIVSLVFGEIKSHMPPLTVICVSRTSVQFCIGSRRKVRSQWLQEWRTSIFGVLK